MTSVLALSGGVGGAKLALGFAGLLSPGRLHVLVNTGDDFTHLGLHISPDIDTLLYTLSHNANVEQGWGLAGESWNAMDALQKLDGEIWFRLGDKDLATHLVRTSMLASGFTLSDVTMHLARQLDIGSIIHPMCDEAVRTEVQCGDERLPFQRYFVQQRCEPVVSGFRFAGLDNARPNSNVMSLLRVATFSSIVICPSNPFVSIDPILQMPDFWPVLSENEAPVVLVSPIVGGVAIKGPAAKMMRELGAPVTALGVAQHYNNRYPGLLDYFVIDEDDAALAADIGRLGMSVVVAPTVMRSKADKEALAKCILDVVGR